MRSVFFIFTFILISDKFLFKITKVHATHKAYKLMQRLYSTLFFSVSTFAGF